MNYLNQINGFWAKSESDELSAIDISVYFSLLKYCNSLNWLNPYVCHWHIVCQYSKCSKNAFYKSIHRLHDKEYIIYRKGNRSNLQPKITVLQFENTKGIVREQIGNNGGITEEYGGNLYKLLNKETIKLLNLNIELVNNNIENWIKKEISITEDNSYTEFEEIKNYISVSSEKVYSIEEFFKQNRGIWAHDFPIKQKINFAELCSGFMEEKSQQVFNDLNHLQNAFVRHVGRYKQNQNSNQNESKISKAIKQNQELDSIIDEMDFTKQ